MKLIETDAFIKAARLKRGLGGGSAAKVLMTVLRIKKLNKLYDELSHHQGMDFIDALIEKLDLDYEISEDELSKIPKSGAFITVSNHPFGGIDGMLLVKILSRIRPDIKVMSNFILNKIEPVSEYMLPVNPFERRKEAASSLVGIKLAVEDAGKALGKPVQVIARDHRLDPGIANEKAKELYEKEKYILHLKNGENISVSSSGYKLLKSTLRI